MSRIVAAAAIRGAYEVTKQAEEFLQRAIKEKGESQRIEFPETAYYLPMANALLGIEARLLKDIRPILAHAKSLLPQVPKDKLWLPYLGDALDAGIATMLCEEIICALRYLYGTEPQPDCVGFYTDTWQRRYGIQLVDGRMPGFAAILGAAPDNRIAVDIVREFQKRNIICFVGSSVNGRSIVDQLKEEKVEMSWETYIVPFGRDTISAIYPLNWAIRSSLTFGGLKPGQAKRCLLYTKERVFAFGLVLGKLDDVKYATGAGAINMGFPVIADTDIPEIKPSGITTYEALVKEFDHKKIVARCIEVRGVKVKLATIPVPVPYAAAFEGERVRKEQLYVEFGGKASLAFEYLTAKSSDEIEDGKVELVGPDIDRLEEGKKSLPLAIIVEVYGRKMQKDFEPILERQIHRFINYAMGLMHIGQRDMSWIRISKDAFNKGFRIKHIGVILHAMLHQAYGGIIDKVQVKLYTQQEDVEKLLEEAKIIFKERDERIIGMTDETVDTFYSCLLCVPKGENIVFADGSFKKVEDVISDAVEGSVEKVLSFDTYDFQTQAIGELFINPAPRFLTKLNLRSGNCLILTPNHKVLVDTKEGLIWQEAAKLKENDRVVSIKNTNIENERQEKELYIIDFFPDTLKVYDDDFIDYLKGKIISKYKKLGILAKEMGINYGRFYQVFYNKAKHRHRLTLEEVKKITSKLGLDWNGMKLKINVFGTTRSKGYRLLKNKLDQDLMYLAGLVASGGCVIKRKNGLHVQFTNSEEALIEKFDGIIASLFGMQTKRYYALPKLHKSKELKVISKKKVTILHVNNSIFGWILRKMGIGREEGKKWTGEVVSKLPNNLVASFLRGLFDGDGRVTKTHLLISTGNYREAQHILLLFKKLGISSYITKTTRGFQVATRNFDDYKKFRETISSLHPVKRSKMDETKFHYDTNHVVRSDAIPLKCSKLIQNLFLKYKNRIEFTKLAIDYKSIEYWRKARRRASKEKLKLFLDSIKDFINHQDSDYQKLLLWAHSNIVFEKVKSVKKVKYNQKEVYNFSVIDTHNYLVNGVAVKNCQSFAPNHVCIVTPERLGLCGSISWLDAKASYEINPTGPNQPITKGDFLNEKLGQWKSANDFVYQKSNKSVEKVSMYSLMDSPQTSCVVGSTQVVIDNEVLNIGDFIDKHRAGGDYVKSQALTLNKGKSILERIVAMQRFELPKEKNKLIRIKTKSGTEIILTPDHRLAIDRPEGLNWVRASQLNKNDRIISLKRLKLEERSPDIYDLIPDNFRVRDEKLINKIKQDLSLKYGALSKALKKLSLEYFLNGSIAISELKIILEDLGKDWKKIRRSVARFGVGASSMTISSQQINKDLFYLIGLIASDGTIVKRGNHQYEIYFINTQKELVNKYKRLYKSIFPDTNLSIAIKKPNNRSFIKGRKINSTKVCYYCRCSNPIFGILFDYFGVVPGLKGKRYFKNFLNLPKDYIASFLTGLFDGDGSVRIRKYKNIWDVAEAYLCTQSKHSAYYLQWLLKRFGILSNVRKSNSIYKIVMHDNNIYELSKIINPAHKVKTKIMKKVRLLYSKKKLDKTQSQVLPFSAAKILTNTPESKSILSPTTHFYYKTFRSRPVLNNIQKVMNKLSPRESKLLKSLLDYDFYLDIVKEVKQVRANGRYVYNLTLSDTHCYFANQMLIKNCGCFECIIAIIPEANGFMIVNRDYAGMTPCGMTFTTLAGSVGGGVQTPGFLGIGKLYILSKKFISAEGGLRRVVWMPKELKELLGDKLKKRAEDLGVPDLIDKIADETQATTSDELLNFLNKVHHPVLDLEPLLT